MTRIFPEVEFENWQKSDRLLPQAQNCASLIITHNLQSPECARVLNQTALYLQERARYSEAQPLYQRALNIIEETLGPEHPNTQTVRANYEDLLKKMEREKD